MKHAQWKADVDAALSAAQTLIDAPEATDCQSPNVENSNYAAWLSDLQTKMADTVSQSNAMPTVCVPPPSGPTEGWINGKTWQVGVKVPINSYSNLSGCCWHRGRNTILATNEDVLVEFNMSGGIIRAVALNNPPINPTNGATLIKKFESVSIVSEDVGSDRISILYEGLTNQTPAALVPVMLAFDLPNGATSVDLSTAEIHAATGFVNDTEAHAWDVDATRWNLWRQGDNFGYMLPDGTTVNQGLPSDPYPRRKVKDCCFNKQLSPCLFTLGQSGLLWMLSERSAATGVILYEVDLTTLLEQRPHEGLAITDSGSIVVVDENQRFTRLDLV